MAALAPSAIPPETGHPGSCLFVACQPARRHQTVAFMTAHLALRHGCSGTARAALGHPPFGLAHCQFRRRAAVLAVET